MYCMIFVKWGIVFLTIFSIRSNWVLLSFNFSSSFTTSSVGRMYLSMNIANCMYCINVLAYSVVRFWFNCDCSRKSLKSSTISFAKIEPIVRTKMIVTHGKPMISLDWKEKHIFFLLCPLATLHNEYNYWFQIASNHQFGTIGHFLRNKQKQNKLFV